MNTLEQTLFEIEDRVDQYELTLITSDNYNLSKDNLYGIKDKELREIVEVLCDEGLYCLTDIPTIHTRDVKEVVYEDMTDITIYLDKTLKEICNLFITDIKGER